MLNNAVSVLDLCKKNSIIDLIIISQSVTTRNCNSHSDWCSAVLQSVKRFPIA